MATTTCNNNNNYQTSFYNNYQPRPASKTYIIKFHEHRIVTTVTKDPDVVSAWIYETEKIHKRHLNRLIVGLDTEWQFLRYNYGNESKVAVMQICVGSRCLIFQIMRSSIVPPSLMKFMNNRNYTFTGVGVDNDVNKLSKDYGLGYEAQVMDLKSLAKKVYEVDTNTWGLKTLTHVVLGKYIEKPKRITLSPWAKYTLSYEQVEYACLDAFVSYEIARILTAKAASTTTGDHRPRGTIMENGMPLQLSMFRSLEDSLKVA